MGTFLQTLFGFAAAFLLVGFGFYLGQATAPSEIVDCLEWVAAHFDSPNVGQLATLCHGSR